MSKKVSKRDVNRFAGFAKKNPLLALVIVLIAVGLLIWQSIDSQKNRVTVPMDGLYVHYIDVGQGDSELVCCNGEYMLIDGGEPSASDELLNYLDKLGIEKLDYLVCTHAHADHCGGLDAVVEALEVETVFTSPYASDSPSYEIFADAVYAAGLDFTIPELEETFMLGGASFSFIGPLRDYDNQNDDSLVMRLEYGDTYFLFTGDMTAKAEKDLINDGTSLQCDVLKVGHHGSSGSSCYQFLYEAQPKIGVISCETGNSYGHPHEECLSRLSDADVTVYRTDLDGSVVIFSDGMKVERRAA